MARYDVLVDSDAFIGFVVEKDIHHKTAKSLFHHLVQDRAIIVTTNYVITETASTLSRRFSQAQAKKFMQFANNVLTIHISEQIHNNASTLFRQQSKDKTSLVDLSNVIVMEQFQIPCIFAFDKTYTQDFHLDSLG